VARAVVLLTLDSVVLGPAVMLLVFRVVAVSKAVLQLSGVGLQPMATLAPVTRGLATGTARMVPDTMTGTGRMRRVPRPEPQPLLVTARVTGRATMAATTLPPTGEEPTGAFWSAAELNWEYRGLHPGTARTGGWSFQPLFQIGLGCTVFRPAAYSSVGAMEFGA
jgi:hypothetical protein